MSRRSERAEHVMELFEQATGVREATARDIAQWAVANGAWTPEPADMIDLCAAELKEGWQEVVITDQEGRKIRSMVSVPGEKKANGEQQWLWKHIQDATYSQMEQYATIGRRRIAGEVSKLALQIEYFNGLHPNRPPIQVHLNFEDDVAELNQPLAVPVPSSTAR